MKPRLHLLAAAALATASAASQGATLQLNNWTYGNGNAVNVVTTPSFHGQAGGFSGTLSGAGPGFDGSIETYCVELTQTFNLGSAYNNYNLVTAGSYFSAAKVDTLGKLLSYANPIVAAANNNVDDNYSTALQLAIWNTVYDNDSTVSSGNFKDTSGFAAQANAFLSGAANFASNLDLWVLESKTGTPRGSIGHQDQLLWRPKLDQSNDVPEPASLALALAAVGALGWSSRRRKSAAR